MRTTVPTTSPVSAYDARLSHPAVSFQRVLAAVRGSAADESVLRVAAQVARRHRARVDAVTVYQPRVLAPRDALIRRRPMEESERGDAAAWMRGARGQVRRLRPSGQRWPLHRAVGEPGAEIARTAARVDADLTLVGLGRQAAEERALGSRVALRMAQLAGSPLLAVARGRSSSWHRGVALLDGRRNDQLVLRTLAALLGEQARVLVIAPPAFADLPDPQAASAPPGGLEVRYERVTSAADAEMVALRAGERLGADVLALPLYGGSPAIRGLTNSRALRLLTMASCSILLVPEPGWPSELLS